MKYSIFFSLVALLIPILAQACPETLRFGDPCNPLVVDSSTVGLSIYQDYQDKTCTKPLLYDGVCPDYLQGGCASIGECHLIFESNTANHETRTK